MAKNIDFMVTDNDPKRPLSLTDYDVFVAILIIWVTCYFGGDCDYLPRLRPGCKPPFGTADTDYCYP